MSEPINWRNSSAGKGHLVTDDRKVVVTLRVEGDVYLVSFSAVATGSLPEVEQFIRDFADRLNAALG